MLPGWFEEDHAALFETASRFARERGLPALERWRRQRRVDADFFREGGRLGLWCCALEEDLGGGGGGIAHDFAVIDAIARAGISPAPFQVHSVIVPAYLRDYGSPELKQRLLPAMARGELIGALAMTEPDTGSDVQAIRTTARRDGDHYVLNGAKTFITNGSIAGVIVVAASTDREAGGRGLSLFVVETAGLDGFSVPRVLEKMGHHESDTAELSLVDVRVPAVNLLGTEGHGFAMLKKQLPTERLIVAVTATAAIEDMVRETTAYANTRKTFGRPLIEHQNVKFRLAECATTAFVARTTLDACVTRLLTGDLDDVAAAMTKFWFSEAEQKVADTCLQIHGGYGYMDEYSISHRYTAARAQRIYGGANEIMLEIIGRSLTRTRPVAEPAPPARGMAR